MAGHTPYGYRIKDGKAVTDETEALAVKKLFEGYLAGLSLNDAAKAAGIKCYHATVSKMLTSPVYLGDDFYPAIVDEEIFRKAGVEKRRRAEMLGRIWKPKELPKKNHAVGFEMKSLEQKFDDPFRQAEYAYSLIEREG